MIDRKLLTALVTASLVLGGAGLALATTDGDVRTPLLNLVGFAPETAPSDACADGIAEPSFPEDAEVQEWTGEVPADLRGGALDLFAFDGGVHVTTWSKDTYRVEVGEVDPNDRLTPVVEATTTDGVFSLEVNWEDAMEQQAGPVSVAATTFDRAHAEVKVWVPDLSYASLHVRQSPPSEGNATVRLGTVNLEPMAMEESPFPLNALDLRAVSTVVDSYDRPLNARNISGDGIVLDTYSGPLHATDLTIRSIVVDTYSAPACLASTESRELVVDTYSGPVTLRDTAARSAVLDTYSGPIDAGTVHMWEITLDSYSGPISAHLVPAASGGVVGDTYSGNLDLTVAAPPDIGYDVFAESDSGDVHVDLPNTTANEEESEYWTRTEVTATSPGFEDRPVQVEVHLESYSGAVSLVGKV